MLDEKTLHKALQDFAQAVAAKSNQPVAGEPEDQLRGPFEFLMKTVGEGLTLDVVCTGETTLPGRIGKPDYAVHARGVLTGYAELKAPGMGADTSRFKGHNRNQWERFKSIPNLLYTDGNDWGLYRNGEKIDLVRMSGDLAAHGMAAIDIQDAAKLLPLLHDYLSWQPIIPKDIPRLAQLLAPLCRFLRDDVAEALSAEESPLVALARDWRELLFPDAADEEFADAYAQTITFALLLARGVQQEHLTLNNAIEALSADHTLLSRALSILTDDQAKKEISASLNMLVRIIAEIEPATLTQAHGKDDPWIYFYEDFLAAYDPKLRKDVGAYYTPVQVVRAQVRLIDELLVNKLEKKHSFADRDVVVLDPAAGTGTYLLGVIDHTIERVADQQGMGAVAGQANALAENIYGFEIMVGPFAVSELRVSQSLQNRGAQLPNDGIHIYLTDTLESPYASPARLGFHLEPLAQQHRKALQVKEDVPVIVCLGNPPYDRHSAADVANKSRTGGWVRWGDKNEDTSPILNAFTEPARAAGHGVHLKNLYNLYVYFWRWALWKVFEHKKSTGPGVVSFITASSYLDGKAFVGMREKMRRLCDEVWIIDLAGEGRGTHKDENVFAIQTPVAIAVTVRYGPPQPSKAAAVHFTRIEGTEKEKLQALDKIHSFADLTWEDCPSEWQAPFRPAGKGAYFDWPAVIDLFPWQHSGAQIKRTWPISPDTVTLQRRWEALLRSDDRPKLFKETRDRKVKSSGTTSSDSDKTSIEQLPRNAPHPPIARYAYRSFDRQWILADSRLGDFLRPALWNTQSDKQVYITSLFTQVLGSGPALTAAAEVPDLHHFSGRGAKDVVPLYRDRDAKEPNILPGLLDLLQGRLSIKMSPELFLSYIYGVMAHPGYTRQFDEQFRTCEVRVPITKNPSLFKKVAAIGSRLLWLHTYGERFRPKGKHRGQVEHGAARCTKAVPSNPDNYPDDFSFDPTLKVLRVGEGEFAPVSESIYEFEVSGMKVVQSWLKYRMRRGAGKKSSPLDDIRPESWSSQFTNELLELLWILEATLACYPEQEKLLDAVIDGPVFSPDELPDLPDAARRPPSTGEQGALFDQA